MTPPASPGMPLAEIDTPALLVDLDAMERNLGRMAALAARYRVRLRPHAKTHKSPIVAAQQIARGAIGVCCQKIAEAEALVHGGIGDVLVTNEIVGRRKLDRLAALAGEASIAVLCDNAAQIAGLDDAAERARVRLEVLVEIDVGGGRCGIAPGMVAADLAAGIAGSRHLRFAGLHAYFGTAQHFRKAEQRRAAVASAGALVRATLEGLAARGLACDVVTGAGTGTCELEAASGVWSEIQPGSYVFMDADYARNEKEDGTRFDTYEQALFVLAAVMSVPAPERAIVDAGHKALSHDSGPPEVRGREAARYHRPSDEHGILDLAACSWRPVLGEKVLLVPGHCDPTVNLHDWYVGVRGLDTPAARVAALWPVAARGALL